MKDKSAYYILGGAAIAALFFTSSKSPGQLSAVVPAHKLSPQDFTHAYYPFAISSEISTGVPAIVTIAQAALESGWGEHAPSFNFFGIKPGRSWTGAIQKLRTWECGSTGDPHRDGINDEIIAVYPPSNANGFAACRNSGKYSYRTLSPFRAYNNAGQSFYDHGRFLRDNARYAKAFQKTTAEDFAREIAAAGYATSTPGYANSVISIMNRVRPYISAGISGTFAAVKLQGSDEIEKSTFPIRLG